jgi:pyruvate dehydrogenase E2 component (dihydrolipoamide acetyltransferase)
LGASAKRKRRFVDAAHKLIKGAHTMATEITLPALGENVPGGDVIEIKVKVGDQVKVDQPLFEVEAEKSTVAVPSPLAGRIAKLLVKKGDHVTTGQALAVIEDGDGKAAAKPEPQAAPTKERQAEAKPAEAKPPAATAPGAERPAPAEKPAVAASPVSAKPQAGAEVHAGPATRQLAREWGVDLARVPGSGVKGRVTQDDVKDFVRNLAAGGGGGRAVAAPALPNFEKWGPIDVKPLESIRKRTAEHVSLAWGMIPHVTHHDAADVTEIEGFRKQQAESKGPKLTVTAFVLKAAAIMLKQAPRFNASLDDAGGQLIFKNYWHIGIAVDTDKGLVVPVIRDVDQKTVQQIAQEMADVAQRAREGKLKPDDMQGGTFTISNLGGIGGTGFSPIVNWPQVAILGLSRSRQEPVWHDGQWQPRLRLPLSLSYDHRVIDGADAARFCRRLAELLENPMMMLLHA